MESQYEGLSSLKSAKQQSLAKDMGLYNNERQTFWQQQNFNDFLVENDAIEVLKNPRQIRGKESYVNINLGKIAHDPWKGVAVGFIRSYLIEKDLFPTQIYGTDQYTTKIAEDLEVVMKSRSKHVHTSMERPLVLDSVTYNGERIIRTIGKIDQEILDDTKEVTALSMINSMRHTPKTGIDHESTMERFSNIFHKVSGIEYKTPGFVQDVFRQANIEFEYMTTTPQLISHYAKNFNIPQQSKEGIIREFSHAGITSFDWE